MEKEVWVAILTVDRLTVIHHFCVISSRKLPPKDSKIVEAFG